MEPKSKMELLRGASCIHASFEKDMESLDGLTEYPCNIENFMEK